MKGKNLALTVAGIVFAIVAIVHVFRLYYKWDIFAAGIVIPMWVSQVGLAVAVVLSVWMFAAVKKR